MEIFTNKGENKMATNIGLNQFSPNGKVAGMYCYMANLPQPHNIRVSSAQATALNAGAVLTIDNTVAAPEAPAMKQAAVTDRIDGILAYNPITNVFEANDLIAIARSGDFVWMPAAGAITVGADLYFNASNQVTATATAGNSIVGTAWTTAAAEGDFVKVLLNFQTTTA